MYFETGSVMRSFPSSIIIMIATPVTGFVIDAMRNTASFVIGFFDSMSVTPVASKCAIFPCRATSVTPPLISPAAMWRFIISVMRPSRSLERPTSSGFATVVSAAGRRTKRETNSTTARTDTVRSRRFIRTPVLSWLVARGSWLVARFPDVLRFTFYVLRFSMASPPVP